MDGFGSSRVSSRVSAETRKQLEVMQRKQRSCASQLLRSIGAGHAYFPASRLGEYIQ